MNTPEEWSTGLHQSICYRCNADLDVPIGAKSLQCSECQSRWAYTWTPGESWPREEILLSLGDESEQLLTRPE